LALTALSQAYIIACSPVIAKDGIGFIRIARSLASDPVATLRTEDQHPGYPAMVLGVERLVHWLTGRREFESYLAATRLASASCGLLSTLFLWLFARRLYDERIANVTVLLAAVWPLFRLNACDSLSDTPHLMFYLAGAWLAAEGLARGRIAWIASACIASGLAFWVRPEGLVVGAAAMAAFGVRFIQLRSLTRTQLLRGGSILLAALLAAAAVVGPYVFTAGKITSKKLPFHRPVSAHAAAIAAAEPTTGLMAEPPPGATLPDEFHRPGNFAGVLALGIFELARELAQGFYYLALIPLAVGTFARSRPQPTRHVVLLHILLMNGQGVLLLLLYVTAGYISHRHIIPLVAMMLPTAAAGTIWLADEASRRIRFAGSPRRTLVVAICIFYIGLVPKCMRPLHGVYVPVLEAAKWVKAHATLGDTVLATSGYIRFYTELPGILVGCEAPNLPMALAFLPNQTWSFIVLEVDDRTFDRQTLCGSVAQYEQVFELPAHPRKPWAKIVVFQARQHVSPSPAAELAQRARH
jgi:4-amino-4-deoxy-L-arabinose transferase-like glycosyltransferase